MTNKHEHHHSTCWFIVAILSGAATLFFAASLVVGAIAEKLALLLGKLHLAALVPHVMLVGVVGTLVMAFVTYSIFKKWQCCCGCPPDHNRHK